ncbi:hypothetical protein [Citricoccus alkalitolerans]|uniref:Leucine-rich repeat domain-containing protein n=1 Tax=Citricoccus alkalitolerans TaxID=246603 RepID=A0ABV8XYF9_9MICC
MNYWAGPGDLERPTDYQDEEAIRVAATQNDDLTATQARKLVAEWMEFFASGPQPFTSLEFLTRTPRRLFETLAHQTQLEQLEVKWGDYNDLSPIAAMPRLHTLKFQSIPSVTSVDPLASHPSLHILQLHGLHDARDMTALGTLPALRDLSLGGDMNSIRIAHIDSLDFLTGLPQLERLFLGCLIVDSKNYTPMMSLPNLTDAWAMECRGMLPPVRELAAQVLGWNEF